MRVVDGEFQVVSGENVSIDVTPSVNLGNQVAGVRDGNTNLDPFNFTITKDIGHEHTVKIVFGFLGAPDGSQYRIDIDGDAAGNEGPFTRFVRKGTSDPSRGFQFHVVAN